MRALPIRTDDEYVAMLLEQVARLKGQISLLANYLLNNFETEIGKVGSESAVEVAIRLLEQLRLSDKDDYRFGFADSAHLAEHKHAKEQMS